jgi:hypothetical protein
VFSVPYSALRGFGGQAGVQRGKELSEHRTLKDKPVEDLNPKHESYFAFAMLPFGPFGKAQEFHKAHG